MFRRDAGTAAHRDTARLSADGIDDRHATSGHLLVIAFLAHFLIVLAAWTVTIKFLFPIAYALGHGVPVGTYVYWDFWWVVHLWLAWALLRWQPYTCALAIGVSGVEIAIVVTKFALFLAAPEWTIWTTNWFINKLFVLACFCLMLPYFALYRHRERTSELAASEW